MEAPLLPLLRGLFDRVAATPEGERVLREYDHLLQFTVLDGPSCYVEIRGGRATVAEGTAHPRPMAEAHEYKAAQAVFVALFSGAVRMSDAIHDGQLFPVAAHTTKRHIDHWLATLIRIGLGRPALREIY